MSATRICLSAMATIIPIITTARCSEVAAPGPEPTLSLSGDQVVRYPVRYTETSRHMVTGEHVEGGCAFSNVTTLPPGTTLVFESVVEFDPENCASIVARHPVAEIPAHARPPVRDRSGSQGKSPDAQTVTDYSVTEPPEYLAEEEWQFQQFGGGGNFQASTQAADECPQEFGSSQGVFQNLWHEDPLAINVTESNHSGYWFYHSAICVQYVQHTSYMKRFVPTSWQLTQHNIDFIWHGFFEYVDMDAWGQYVNPGFCIYGTNPTWCTIGPTGCACSMMDTPHSGGIGTRKVGAPTCSVNTAPTEPGES